VTPRSFLLCVVMTVAGTASASLFSPAVAKDCTSVEKAAGNAQLFEIQSNKQFQKQLINYHAPKGLPVPTAMTENESILFQLGYIMNHDADLRTSTWVTYQLNANDVSRAQGKKRVDCFRDDPRLSEEMTASETDYKEPVFDQGHMANDADIKDDFLQQINTYVMSNISPQHCRFNRGIWLSLEHLGRKWAKQYGQIFITSGAVFDKDGQPGRDSDGSADRMESNNGDMRVAIPSHYYKTFIRKDPDIWQSITFLLPHNNAAHGVSWNDVRPGLMGQIAAIQQVEAQTDLHLLPGLNRLHLMESMDGTGWDLNNVSSNFEFSCN